MAQDEWRLGIAERLAGLEEKVDSVYYEIFNHGEGLAAKVDRVTGKLDTLTAVLQDRTEQEKIVLERQAKKKEDFYQKLLLWAKIIGLVVTIILGAHGLIDFIAKVQHGELRIPVFSASSNLEPAYAVDRPQDAKIPPLTR